MYRSAFFECGKAPILVCEGNQPTQELVVDVSCANEQALGPRDGTMWLDVSIELARSGDYLIRGFENPGLRGGFVRLKRCAAACQGAVFEADTAWPDDDFPDTIYEDLPSGRYVLQVHQLAEQQGEVRIEITCP